MVGIPLQVKHRKYSYFVNEIVYLFFVLVVYHMGVVKQEGLEYLGYVLCHPVLFEVEGRVEEDQTFKTYLGCVLKSISYDIKRVLF